MENPIYDDIMSSTLESLPGLFLRNEEAHEYVFSEMSHSLSVLQGLNKQRSEHVLCDVIICIDDIEIPCHRNVLAACSPYFLAMFTGDMRESMEHRVPVTGIDPEIMKQLIDYAYTSDITINQDNAQHLLSAANMVQINSIREACCNFLEKEMDPSNCLGIHCFAEAHVCTSLANKSMQYALENFVEVTKYDEVMLLPESKLIEFLESNELNVDTEDITFQAVIDWAKHDLDTRVPLLGNVLAHVRLPLVDPYFLFDKTDTETMLTESKECQALMDEAKKFYALKDRQCELQSSRTQLRKCQLKSTWLMTIGGEIYNKNYLNSVDCYNMDEEKWLRLKELPFPRCHHGAVVMEAKDIYITGGFNKDKNVLNNVMRYETMLDKWIKVANMNTPRARHGMAVLDGYIYVVGGYDGESRINTVEKYSPVTNKWTYVTNMGVALSRCHAVGFQGFLYVTGGTTEPSNQCVDLMQRFCPRNSSWEVLAPMPVPRCVGGMVTVRGHIYAVGGTEEMVHSSKKLTRYNIHKNQWTELAEIVEPRFDAGVATIDGKLYIMSGHDGENSFYHSIEEYNFEEDTWMIMNNTTMPYGRCRFGCVAITVPNK